MTESLAIFSEYMKPLQILTEEEKHKKRMTLEPLIYDILKAKYLNRFEIYWQTATISKESSKCIVLIERRIHPNLEFVIKNAAYYARGWSLAIVCSDVNLDFCKAILGNQRSFVQLLPMFQGSPCASEAKEDYNRLLLSKSFYEQFSADLLCITQTDAYFCKHIPQSIEQYDYVAAPFAWKPQYAGGGLSFRNRKTMIQVCESLSLPQKNLPPEDITLCEAVQKLGFTMPSYEKSLDYICESCLTYTAVGVHQWWTFFNSGSEDAETYFACLLHCETILPNEVFP